MSLHGTYDSENIFAKILRGEMPAAMITEDDDAIAIMDAFPQTRNRTRLGFQTRKPYYTSTMIELPRSQIFVHNILALEVLHPTSNLSHDVEKSVYRDAASVSALILPISG